MPLTTCQTIDADHINKFGVGAVVLQRLFFDYAVQILKGDYLALTVVAYCLSKAFCLSAKTSQDYMSKNATILPITARNPQYHLHNIIFML